MLTSDDSLIEEGMPQEPLDKELPDEQVSDPKLQVTVNLGELIFFVESRLQETIQFASFGLAAAADFKESDDIRLPGVLLHLGDNRRSIPGLRSGFDDWLVGVCLRRYVEVYHAFLEKVGPVALLVEFQRESFHYDSEKIENTFNSMSFPKKLNRIDKALSQKVDAKLRGYIESINHARNCFEHRYGIVNQRDLTHDGQCVISWLGADALVRGSEADEWEEVLTMPIVVPPKGEFMMKWVPRERSFAIGDHLKFTAKDIVEMGITYLQHAIAVRGALKQAFDLQAD